MGGRIAEREESVTSLACKSDTKAACLLEKVRVGQIVQHGYLQIVAIDCKVVLIEALLDGLGNDGGASQQEELVATF